MDIMLAQKAITSLKTHLWYLVPKLVVLAQFDSDVSDDEKQLMAVTLLSKNQPAAYATGNPGQPGFRLITDKLVGKRPPLSVFITEWSWIIFNSAAAYLRLTHPPPDHPEDAAATIVV